MMSEPMKRETGLKLSQFQLLDAKLSNIAALTPFEYKKKTEKALCEVALLVDDFFKGAKYVEASNKEIEDMEINIAWYSNYKELLEDAYVLSHFFSRKAYEKGMGRLHRSLARVSIVLALTAAEDYVNLHCVKDKGFTKEKLRKKGLYAKWKLLIPGLDQQFPYFSSLTDLRNEKIIHFKDHEKPSLDCITDLNFENALKAITMVTGMVREYEGSQSGPARRWNTSVFMGDLLSVAKECLDECLELSKEKGEKNPEAAEPTES